MQKRSTINEHKEKINEVISYIHGNLSSKLLVADLARICSYSKFHFHRIFKEITNKSISTYIKESRLQLSANLLIFNQNSTIIDIAQSCGFKSSATFTNEFKKYFDMTPSLWRKNGYKNYKIENFIANNKKVDFSSIEVKNIDKINTVYMRHCGYDKNIKEIWQRFLYLLKKDYSISSPQMIAFLHSNPSITDTKDCKYIVCANILNQTIKVRGDIGTGDIPSGLYATIRYKGEYNDILHLYKKLYYEWLPSSQYEAVSSAAYIIYYKNHFIETDEKFDIEFRMPITYK